MSSDKKITELREYANGLPEDPGVYQFLNKEGIIIYVGKAKILKRRVISYFAKNHEHPKLIALVKNIHEIRYLVVPTEEDALHLESNLIKEHRPRYNVLLKDDKSYPSIAVSREPFPRVYTTRNVVKNGSLYFGPYSNSYLAKTMTEMLKTIYPLRTCNLDLSTEKIKQAKYSPCLQFHIKRCNAPCIGKETEQEYAKYIEQIKCILRGDIEEVVTYMEKGMFALADEMRFEEAGEIKEKYLLIKQYHAKSIVVNPLLNNIDVFGYDENETNAYVNYLLVIKGSIVRGMTIEYKKNLDETKEEILSLAIHELRERFKSKNREIIVPFEPDVSITNTQYHTPQKGDKKKLLDLSLQNVRQYKVDRVNQSDKLNPDQRYTRILGELKKELGLLKIPNHIECFDNSNIQGTSPVSSCVVFINGKPAKKEYRHYHIKSVIGANDFASMQEVIYRRYSRLIEEQKPLPDLIIVDGGKGQLSSAVTILEELSISDKIEVVGIAKRLEEIFKPYDSNPYFLPKKGESIRIIQQLRDEAHRFGITFHRKIRSTKQTKSELDEIKGIGDSAKTALLREFKSILRIKKATTEELEKTIGKHKASLIIAHFKE